MPENEQDNSDQGQSLEGETGSSLEGADSVAKSASTESVAYKKSFKDKLVSRMSVVNIYLIVFLVLLLIVILVTLISLNNAKKTGDSGSVISQDLSAEDLAKLKETDTKVGDPKQTLTIESNTIINGKVLVRDGIDIAGGLTVGKSLSITGLSVAGTSSFEIVKISGSLEVAGSGSFQKGLTIVGNLQSSGGATFSGTLSAATINVDNLKLNGDLVINRHIDTTGSVPAISAGSAVGGGGTVSISGSDTSGTVNINTGGGAGTGLFCTITFSNAFSSTPHVVISPVGSATSAVDYYVTKTTTGFSIYTSSDAPDSSPLSFDYIVLD